ncbi:MAG: hypothetical protein R6V14_01025 [Halanaerobiales bacterium]
MGTDSVTRNLRSLSAKARALEEEGITNHIYRGSYRVPVNTITEGSRKFLPQTKQKNRSYLTV